MAVKAERLEQALAGTLAQCDLRPDEARAFDAMTAARIDAAVSGADFTDVPPVDHTAMSAVLRRRLVAFDDRAGDATPG